MDLFIADYFRYIHGGITFACMTLNSELRIILDE